MEEVHSKETPAPDVATGGGAEECKTVTEPGAAPQVSQSAPNTPEITV